ncbi:MAG: glycoside hydrolase family 43 protein [Clostridia bacterium]|nr:glycoside hydrolase family 43 protein [Clostridia bacterium]
MSNKTFRLRRALALLLAAILLFSAVPVSASAAADNTNKVYSLELKPSKEAYAAGEEIEIKATVRNLGFSDMIEPELYMTYSKSDTYLVSGRIFAREDRIGSGQRWEKTFNLFENNGAKEKGEEADEFIARILRFFCHFLSRLSPIFRHIETDFQTLPGSLSRTFSVRTREKAGACTVLYDGREIECTFFLSFRKTAPMTAADVKKIGETEGAYSVTAELTPSEKEVCGVAFGADLSTDAWSGGFVFLDPAGHWAGIARMNDGAPEFLSVRYSGVKAGEPCRVKVNYDGGRTRVWVYDNPLDPEPYPLFDLPAAFDGADAGVCGAASDAQIGPADPAFEGETYTNPLYPNSADPFVLYEDGVYYLYATNNGTGYNAATSTDLVHWTDAGQVAFMGDVLGDSMFWAPEVYKYNGRFYLFYTASIGGDQRLAVAVADSPLGPFEKTSDAALMERSAIDGNVLFDDDGRIWLYVVHFGVGNHIWVYEMNDDLISVKEGSGVKLTEPRNWEGTINEGPAVLKHNGVYYLTYSGDDYQSVGYSVGCMTSDSPTGPFTRTQDSPILKADVYVHGPGHHSFAYSPDGSEMFIVYHCHNTLTEVHPRALCIDRVRFVPQPDGPDRLVVFGPTVTPQPMP